MKVKDFKKFSNKDIYCSLKSNSAKYNKPFKFFKTFFGWLEML